MNTKSLNNRADFYIRLLFIVAIILGLLDLFYSDMKLSGVYWFNLDKERNIPTWYSGALFTLFGMACLLAYFVETGLDRKYRPAFPALWLGVGLVGFLLSLDEITILHENLFWAEIRNTSEKMGGPWIYITQWQLVFAPVIILLVSAMALFFTQRFLTSKRSALWAFAGLGFWVLALLLEGVRGAAKFSDYSVYRLEVLLEEEFEMAGAICLLSSIIYYAIDIGSGTVRSVVVNARFFSLRAFGNLAILSAVFALSGVLFFTLASGQADNSAPVPTLFKKAHKKVAVKNRQVWFKNLAGTGNAETEEKKRYAQSLADGLYESWDTIENNGAPKSASSRPAIIFISAGRFGKQAKVTYGSGFDLETAGLTAIKQLKKITGDHWSPEWVKVDIVDFVEKLNIVEGVVPPVFRNGSFGFAFNRKTGIAFLPDEITSRVLLSRKGNLNTGRMTKLLKERDLPFKRLKRLKSKSRGYKFTTVNHFASEKRRTGIVRGHLPVLNYTSGDLLESAVMGGKYLTSAVGPDGRFVYSFDAHKNTSRDKYNILRHAGTIYAMMELYEIRKDSELLASSKRAIGYLSDQIVPMPGASEALAIMEKGSVKLGGAGLAIIALIKYMDVTGDASHLDTVKKLGDGMVHMLRDDGSSVHKISYPGGVATDFISEYYPGESILAFMRLYKLDGDEKWLESAYRSTLYLIKVRDKDTATENLIHDHWLLYGLNELYRAKKDDLLLLHARRIVTAIVAKQSMNPPDRYDDWRGSYYTPPRSTPTATRSEGLCAAYNLFTDMNKLPGDGSVLAALKAGVRFQLQTQFAPETTIYLEDPNRALGGFHRSLTNFEIRIDYVQHNISSLLCLKSLMDRE